MAAPAYIGDVYLAGLKDTYGDTPSLDPKLVADHATLLKVYADLAKGLDATQARRELATLEANQRAFDSITKARTALSETRSKNSRVTAQNFQQAIEAAEKVDMELARREGVDTPQVEEAYRAFSQANGGPAGAVAFANTLTHWFDRVTGRPLTPNHPNIDVIMNRAAEKIIGKPLTRETTPELIAALGTSGVSQTLRDQWTAMVNAGALRRDELTALQATNRQDLESLRDASGKYARMQAGDPKGKAIEVQLSTLMDDLSPRLMKALGRDAADIAAEHEIIVTQNAQLEKIKGEADRLGALIYGGKPADPIAKLVASPQFRDWAQANGMNLGQASVDPSTGKVAYVPGADDSRAISLYMWQIQHPGRYSPIRHNKSTGAFVRVTVEDPAQREKIIAKYRASNGKFYMDTNGNLVPPSEAANTLQAGGYAPSLEWAVVGDKDYIRKPDGTVIDAHTGQIATAPAGAKFVPALYEGADGTARYLTLSDIDTPEKVTALFNADERSPSFGPETVDDAAAVAAHLKTAPLAERTEDQMRSTWTNTVSGRLDAKHASDYINPEFGGDTISLDGGAVRIPAGVPATIEVLETKDRFSLGDVAKGWRRRMSEAHAEKLAAQGVPEADVPYLTGLARAAREEFMNRPPEEVAPTTAKVPFVTPGGREVGAVLPIESPAVAASRALDKTPTEARYQTIKAADGKRYRVDFQGGSVQLLNPTGGEKSSWTMDELTPELSTTLQAGEVVDFEGPTGAVSAEAATPEAAPAVPAAAAPVPAAAAPAPKPAVPTFPETARRPEEEPEAKVTLKPPSAQAWVDRAAGRTPRGERIGAALAEAFIPGRPGERGAAPGERGPGALERVRDLFTRKDEGYRAAEKTRKEAEAKAAARTKERERYGAIGETPEARMDVLTDAERPAGTPSKATRPQEGAASQALSRGVGITPSVDEAAMRGRDEALMGLVSKSSIGAPPYGLLRPDVDLADKYKDLQGLKQFNPGLYAGEVRKLADEARERMRTPRDVGGAGVLPVGGTAEGLGAKIESEPKVMRLPSSEAELPVSPFLARVIESRRARAEGKAAPETPPAKPAAPKVPTTSEAPASPDAVKKLTMFKRLQAEAKGGQ